MKTILLALLVSLSANAQVMTFKEAMDVFDQHANSFKKVEVGNQTLNEGYEMHGECVINDKNVMTIVDLTPEYALVLNELTITDKCANTVKTDKFLTKDYMIDLPTVKAQLSKMVKAHWSIKREFDNIITFKGKEGTSEFTFQYDLRNALFTNWVHHHHSYPGVEDHNIKYGMNNRTVPMSEVQGLPVCTREPLRFFIQKCE